MIPAWILYSAAAGVLAAAALSGARLVLASPQRGEPVPSGADTDVAYVLTGLAMAGLLAAGLRMVPSGEWQAVFALLTAWFACRVVRDAHANGFQVLARGSCMPQLASSAAMLYVYHALAVTASGSSEMAGMAVPSGPVMQTLKYPTLAFIFGLVLVGYSIWDLDQVSGKHRSLSSAGLSFRVRGFLLSPDMTVCCRIVIGVTMAFTLFTKIP